MHRLEFERISFFVPQNSNQNIDNIIWGKRNISLVYSFIETLIENNPKFDAIENLRDNSFRIVLCAHSVLCGYANFVDLFPLNGIFFSLNNCDWINALKGQFYLSWSFWSNLIFRMFHNQLSVKIEFELIRSIAYSNFARSVHRIDSSKNVIWAKVI